jgi:hypothetical protein
VYNFWSSMCGPLCNTCVDNVTSLSQVETGVKRQFAGMQKDAQIKSGRQR